MKPSTSVLPARPIAEFQGMQLGGFEAQSQYQAAFSRTSDLRQPGAEQRLKKLGDILTAQRQRSQRERNIKVGRIIPGTAQIKMRSSCDNFRLYNIQVASGPSKVDQVGLSFGRLRHICTGTDRLELIQAHTKSPSIDHWMDSIFNSLPTAPWVLQTNDERSANYLTRFQKSQLSQEWIAEKVVLTQGANPVVITAYPVLDVRKMRTDLKRHPVVNYSGLEQLPTPLLSGVKRPKPQELVLKAPLSASQPKESTPETSTSTAIGDTPSSVSQPTASTPEHSTATLVTDMQPSIQSFEAEAAIILEWTQAENQIQLQLELIENQFKLMTALSTHVVRGVLTDKEIDQLPDIAVSTAMQVFSGLINIRYFDKVDALNAELFLFDQAKTQLQTAFSQKSKKALLHQEFPDLSIKKLVQGWDDRIAVGLKEFYRENVTLTVSRTNLFLSVKPLLADILKHYRQSIEYLRADTYVVRGKSVRRCNTNAQPIHDNNTVLLAKGRNLLSMLDPKSIVFPEDPASDENGLLTRFNKSLEILTYMCVRESVLDKIPGAKAGSAATTDRFDEIKQAHFEAKIAHKVVQGLLDELVIMTAEFERVTHSKFKQSVSKLR